MFNKFGTFFWTAAFLNWSSYNINFQMLSLEAVTPGQNNLFKYHTWKASSPRGIGPWCETRSNWKRKIRKFGSAWTNQTLALLLTQTTREASYCIPSRCLYLIQSNRVPYHDSRDVLMSIVLISTWSCWLSTNKVINTTNEFVLIEHYDISHKSRFSKDCD